MKRRSFLCHWLTVIFTALTLFGFSTAGIAQAKGKKAKLKLVSMSNDEYPAFAKRNQESGTSTAVFNISASGVVTDCIAFGATPGLDMYTCSFIKRRFVFHPAQDRDGRAIFETKTQKMIWRLEKEATHSWPSTRMKFAALKVSADDAGKVDKCKIIRSSGDRLWDIRRCARFKADGLFPTFDASGQATKTEMIFSVPRPIPVEPEPIFAG
jgi:Gram-negative bacterial TonB protein C-terminal